MTKQSGNVGLSGKLRPGDRAITIAVDSTGAIEGWAQPGNHVDVILTYRDRDLGETKSLIVVEDAVVLSFDGSAAKDKTSVDSVTGRRVRQSTVTLSVSTGDMLKLSNATSLGTIKLVLRNPDDNVPVLENSVTDQVFRSPAPRTDNKVQKRQKGFAKAKDSFGNEVEIFLMDDNSIYTNKNEFDNHG